MSLPHYMTSAGSLKGMPVRSWLAVLAVITVLAFRSRSVDRRDAGGVRDSGDTHEPAARGRVREEQLHAV
jgi:hypothetical protein